EHLDWALSEFSGYIAADELYDGPFCILSIVDNRTYKRLASHVLRRDPTTRDVEAFFRRFHAALEARGLTVQGVTTDGSALYPEPIAAVFGDVPHQVCTFHVLRELLSVAWRGKVSQPEAGSLEERLDESRLLTHATEGQMQLHVQLLRVQAG